MPFVGQELIGTAICTEMVCPGDNRPLNGLMLIPFIPLLLADQVTLRFVEVFVNET